MAGSEPYPEKDEPPVTKPPRPLEYGTVREDIEERARPDPDKEEQEREVDDFGLPVQQRQRHSIRPVEDESDSEHAEPIANGQDVDDLSKPDPTYAEKERNVREIEQTKGSVDEPEPAAEHPVHDQPAQADAVAVNEPSQNARASQVVAPAIVDDVLHGNTGAVSGWSHQALAPQKVEAEDDDQDDDWRDMPAFAPYDLYDDEGKLIAREVQDSGDEANVYAGLGGAGKGYTRVQIDEDAKSATSMDDNTDYLFKPKGTDLADEDEEQRDPLAQLQATKNLLTEGQRIAYVGVTRLAMAKMVKDLDGLESTKNTKKGLTIALESMKMWSQQMMVRLYMHMEIDSSGTLHCSSNSRPF